MSRARHKANGGAMAGDKSSQSCGGAFASGGEVYAGAGSNVVKEAMEKKRGGRVGKSIPMESGMPVKRADKRPRKARGGKVGADQTPFSSAARPGQNTETVKP